ncbi:MAG TPA: RNA polymerase sigma factor [Bryobacteraceae bacterium]|nr:RNA polymerase sigma factor [Bryobacteraceae bacterium]
MAHPIDSKSPSEEDLLRRSALGDEEAFLALYRRRQAGVYRFAMHMSGSASIAEEVTQEVFMAVFQEGSRFDPDRGSAAAFLYGIARNQVLRCLERNKRYVGLETEDGNPAEPRADSEDPSLELARVQAIEAVRQAVLTLPAPYREAVVLCDLEEVSYADAAVAMKVPVGTVRSRLSRGRSLLEEKLRSVGKPGKSFNAMRCFA